MNIEEVKQLIKGGIGQVFKKIQSLINRIEELEKEIAELKDQKAKNSTNSSKPPASDGLKKPKKTKSLRTKSNKKSGGQPGHQGSRLEKVEHPDNVITHKASGCKNCGGKNIIFSDSSDETDRRQTFDIPPISIKVTEHQVQDGCCQDCGCHFKTDFPAEVNQPTQYGNNLRSLIVYLNQKQHIPYKRIVDFIEELFGHKMSQGTIFNTLKKCSKNLEDFVNDLKEKALTQKLLHSDETGMRAIGKLFWLHSVSNPSFSLFHLNPWRGKKAMQEMGILNNYKGIVAHDYWRPYFGFEFTHSLCNAHLLREMIFEYEQRKQQWAGRMIALLLKIKKSVDAHKGRLPPQALGRYRVQYDKIVIGGLKHVPKAVKKKGKRGRVKQDSARNLLDRLKKHPDDILRFATDEEIPFDNNPAERDIRMPKLKQKVSGCFRSQDGGEYFSNIQSYLGTLSKHNENLFDSIGLALAGRPVNIFF